MKNLFKNNIENLVEVLKENILKSLNCVKIGRIYKFYPEDKTADVEILNKIKVNDEIKEITLLLKCLVVGNKITLPIEEGEDVVVLFNDVDLNSYFETGTSQLPYSNRRHSISDGIVICGLNSLINSINYDNTAINLNYDTKINGNVNVLNNLNVNKNIEAFTYSTNNKKGVSGTFQDTGAGASFKTLIVENGLIVGIQ